MFLFIMKRYKFEHCFQIDSLVKKFQKNLTYRVISFAKPEKWNLKMVHWLYLGKRPEKNLHPDAVNSVLEFYENNEFLRKMPG